MLPNFKSLPKLLDHFKEESTCIEYLEQALYDGKLTCPHCSSDKIYRTNIGYKCANKECHKKFTIRVGTIFESSKIPLRTWFAAIYIATAHKKGVSSLQLASDLGVTQKTAWFILHRIREMLKEDAPEMLTGTVEIDETFVGGKDTNRHESKKKHITGGGDKAPVMGMLSRDGKVRTIILPDTSVDTMQDIIKANVDTSAELITDKHPSYITLGRTYTHVMVKASRDYRTTGRFHTNNIENFWSMLKRGIVGIYHYVSPKHLHRYCTEFGYRYNERKLNDFERFHDAIQNVKNARLLYKNLIN